MIKTVNLQKIFKTEEVQTWALNNVNIEVKEGEFVAIMGPSGCGKSTLLNILGLLDNPSGGEYYLNGKEVSKYTEAQRTSLRKGVIGFVFQSFNLINYQTNLENVETSLNMTTLSARERRQRATELLTKVGLADHIHKYPSQLSGGQKQRVAIARSLAMKPKALLFDEPTSALDPEMIGDVLDVMRDIAKDSSMTMLVVTHEMSFAKAVADRVIFMADGQILEDSTTQAFFDNPKEARAKKFLSQVEHH